MGDVELFPLVDRVEQSDLVVGELLHIGLDLHVVVALLPVELLQPVDALLHLALVEDGEEFDPRLLLQILFSVFLVPLEGDPGDGGLLVHVDDHDLALGTVLGLGAHILEKAHGKNRAEVPVELRLVEPVPFPGLHHPKDSFGLDAPVAPDHDRVHLDEPTDLVGQALGGPIRGLAEPVDVVLHDKERKGRSLGTHVHGLDIQADPSPNLGEASDDDVVRAEVFPDRRRIFGVGNGKAGHGVAVHLCRAHHLHPLFGHPGGEHLLELRFHLLHGLKGVHREGQHRHGLFLLGSSRVQPREDPRQEEDGGRHKQSSGPAEPPAVRLPFFSFIRFAHPRSPSVWTSFRPNAGCGWQRPWPGPLPG